MTTSPVMGITEEILSEIERAGWQLVPVEPTREMWAAAGDCVTTLQWQGIGHHDKISGAVYRAMLAATPAAPVAQEPATWPAAAHNLVRDWQTGMASSNEVCIALASALCGTPPAAEQPECGCCGQTGPCDPDCDCAEQPGTVTVPRELLAEAESIIDSYAEALRASHAPGGDWEGEEAAHDEYELEAGVASKLRALLAGGAE